MLFKNSRREAFQIEVQLLFPEALQIRTAVVVKQSVKLASRKGVREEAELPHLVLFASAENWLEDSFSV